MSQKFMSLHLIIFECGYICLSTPFFGTPVILLCDVFLHVNMLPHTIRLESITDLFPHVLDEETNPRSIQTRCKRSFCHSSFWGFWVVYLKDGYTRIAKRSTTVFLLDDITLKCSMLINPMALLCTSTCICSFIVGPWPFKTLFIMKYKVSILYKMKLYLYLQYSVESLLCCIRPMMIGNWTWSRCPFVELM